jgi:hypothetical protein
MGELCSDKLPGLRVLDEHKEPSVNVVNDALDSTFPSIRMSDCDKKN